MVNKRDYAELVLSCTELCQALDRRLHDVDKFSVSVLEVVKELTA